ncbi:hypothetical protein HHK36_008510 [Tetracentron sinense]|uniref:non-specific serine/threonine protein kinase n=1 Tax=Tetracentron sinense TaxID=13715 RepID=A0A835DK10_TETSI|nr:hypothetical protein HHK36_008510 [Tetracentron sinense]
MPPPATSLPETPTSSPPPKASSPPPPLEDSSSPPPPPSSKNNSPPSPSDTTFTPPSPPPSDTNSTPPSPLSQTPNLVPSPPPPESSSLTPPSSEALPPPHSATHKTPPASFTPPHSNSSPSNNSLVSENLPIIIGFAAGAGLLLIIMIVIFASCAKKKKRRPNDQLQYYRDPSGPKGSEYYNNAQHPNWRNTPQLMDHMVKIVPLPPGAMGPPTPPPMMSSSEMSSNFSGTNHPHLPPSSQSLALGFNKSTFNYEELAAATGGFAQANLLGQGGFGYVHKGVLPNGKEVAVKSLKSGSGQGEQEFQAEVEIISRVHHRHLVSLVGYCIAGGQRMLVYEFVPNYTMEYHLHGKDRPTMEWSTRLRIALGSAKGLAYLHEDCHPRIIHRDIKAANILIDYNFEAMVADFGLAKLSSDTYTHVSTRVMGTFGYLAPEYASSGKLTEKSDVFSYGVMLLELITGRRPVDTTNTFMEDSLVDWARPILTRALTDGNYDELVDPRLENNYSPHEMAQMVACAASSIRHSARRRPKMSQIVRALEGEVSLEVLNDGVKPGQSSVFTSSGSLEYNAGSYNTDMKKFRKMAMPSQEYGSSDYDATSEYGLNPSSSSDEYSREMNPSRNWRRGP